MSHTTYRNRHSRSEQHFGAMEATLVEISSALGVDIPVGMTLDAAIAVVNARISRLENADVHVFGLKADAVKLESLGGSFTAEAWLGTGAGTGSFTADAIVKDAINGSFSADAILLYGQQDGVSADAWFVYSTTDTLSADAVIFATVSASISADAYITDGSAPAPSSTMGEMTLGESTLGG